MHDVCRSFACRLLAALVGALLTLALAAPAEAGAEAARDSLRSTLDTTVRAYAERSGAEDTQYFADGQWMNGMTSCWTCSMGASVGAAALVAERPELLPVVVSSVDRAIRDRQRANGAFWGPGATHVMQSAWFVPILGTVYLTMGDRLDAATRARWVASIVAASDWLVSSRETVRYSQGNVNLSYAFALWTAWKVTGEQRFGAAYEAAMTVAIGFGLRLTRTPTSPDWSDGAGYFTEAGGFDAVYAQLQLDLLASFHAVSDDPRALRLMNVLVNALLPRVGPTFTLDARNGTRHNVTTAFVTPALSVLVASGSRPDLAHLRPGQAARVATEYSGAVMYMNPGYRGAGTWLAAPLIAAADLPDLPVIPSPVRPQPSTPVPKPPAPPAVPSPAPPIAAPATSVSQPRTPGAPSARAAYVTVSSRARVRSGALRVAVEAPAGATVRASLLCGSVRCGTARDARVAGDAAVTLRVKLGRNLKRTVQRTGRRVATAVIHVRAGGHTHTEHRSVWFYR